MAHLYVKISDFMPSGADAGGFALRLLTNAVSQARRLSGAERGPSLTLYEFEQDLPTLPQSG